MSGDEPKPLVFPPKPEAGGEHEPRPLDFSKMTTDWIPPPRPEKVMAEPKGLNFGSMPSPRAKSPENAPRGLQLPAPAPPGHLTLSSMNGDVSYIRIEPTPAELLARLRPQQTPAAPREAIIGGDPRAPALLEKAKTLDPLLAGHRLFRARLETFLDLRPSAWVTWAENDLRVLVNSASAQAECARQLSLANAVKWASDCEQAYKKPPGLFDRLTAPKPEFYRERLSQARDALQQVAAKIETLQADLKPRLETVSVDALVLQVATADAVDPSDQITSTRRLQTIVGGQQTGLMIVQALENMAVAIATQKATVSDLLTITIPNWILAQSKA